MSLTCKTCGYKVEDHKLDRCPRCYSIIQVPKKCSDCQGCSLWKKDCDEIQNLRKD